MASALDSETKIACEVAARVAANQIMDKIKEIFSVNPAENSNSELEPDKSSIDVDVFNDALLENPSDFEEVLKKLDYIMKSVKNMKKNIKQMIARNSQNEDSVHKSEENEELDVPENKFTENEVKVLKKVAAKDKLNSDGYYRRTILLRNFSNCDQGEADSNYQRCMNIMRNWDLGFLLDRAEKFFVSDKTIRLTFPTRRRAIKNLLEAKNCVQNLPGCPVNIECMVPPSEVARKCVLLQKMKDLKQQRLISSYSVFETKSSGTWIMKVRLFKRGFGTFVFNNANEAKNYLLGHLGHVHQTANEE